MRLRERGCKSFATVLFLTALRLLCLTMKTYSQQPYCILDSEKCSGKAYEYQQNNNVFRTIEVDDKAHVTLFDYDGDGDNDLILAQDNFYNNKN